ncbi:hypothetical protein D3C81_734850 [compost metagenome]
MTDACNLRAHGSITNRVCPLITLGQPVAGQPSGLLRPLHFLSGSVDSLEVDSILEDLRASPNATRQDPKENDPTDD